MRRLLFPLFAALLLASCISRPDNVLDEDRMTEVLIDVHMAEGLLDVQRDERRGENRITDEYQQEVIAAVLKRHEVSKSDYDSSLVWYSKNLSSLIRVYERVTDSLAARNEWWLAQASEMRSFPVSMPGDSINVWSINSYCLLQASEPFNSMIWRIEPDSNYMAGDTLRWAFNTHQTTGRQLIASLSLQMSASDSTWTRGMTEVVRNDGRCQLAAAADSGVAIRNITLSAHLLPLNSNDSTSRKHPLVIDQISLMRYHFRN